jgi:hypothetical protein
MKEAWVKALGPSNQYAVVNILSVLWTLPVCLALEVPNFKENWDRALRKGSKEEDIYKNTVPAPRRRCHAACRRVLVVGRFVVPCAAGRLAQTLRPGHEVGAAAAVALPLRRMAPCD